MKTSTVVMLDDKELRDVALAAAKKGVNTGAGPVRIEFVGASGELIEVANCRLTFEWGGKIKE